MTHFSLAKTDYIIIGKFSEGKKMSVFGQEMCDNFEGVCIKPLKYVCWPRNKIWLFYEISDGELIFTSIL